MAQVKMQAEQETISFTRIKNDTNGNPRFVCHFLNLLTESESNDYSVSVTQKYNNALFNSRKIGGRKFHNKQYGGGIVFQSYNLTSLVAEIASVTGRNFTGHEVNC